MSTKSSTEISCLDGFIKTSPKMSHSSKSLSKIALVFSALSFTLAMVVCAMMIVNNPNTLYFSQWHWTQLTFFGVNMGVSILSLITGLFFSLVNQRVREKTDIIKN